MKARELLGIPVGALVLGSVVATAEGRGVGNRPGWWWILALVAVPCALLYAILRARDRRRVEGEPNVAARVLLGRTRRREERDRRRNPS